MCSHKGEIILRPYLFSLMSLLCLFVLSLHIGPSNVSILDIFHLTPTQQMILFDLRLNRTFVCIFVGGSLAVSGFLLQSFVKNPLAEPYTLGLSGGASLGAVFCLAMGWSFLFLGSFLGCWIITLVILYLHKQVFFKQKQSLILLGVMISFLCGSVITLTISLMQPDKLQTALFWMIGQCGTERDRYWYLSCLALLICLLWSLRYAKKLDLFLIDEKTVQAFGSQKYIERYVILMVSLLTSIAVSICGLIGFVGLISPHICRLLLKTARHQACLLFSAVLGALFFLSADILGRWLGGTMEIPTGSITALMGSPVFLWLLLKRRKPVV